MTKVEALHVCRHPGAFPLDRFHQIGSGKGKKLLIVGESPAPNGWVISGKACYRPDGKILPTGKRLNQLLETFDISVEVCGFTELSKCFVSKRAELGTCSERCWPIFLKQVASQDYALLLILGVLTTRIFSKQIGTELAIGEIVDVTLEGKTYKVLPIFHPSPVNPTGHAKNIELFSRLYDDIESILT
jgi:uracil-DNA glycosylase